MATPTEQLHKIIIRGIEIGPHPYSERYGLDWFNISPEEEHVFGLVFDELPSLVHTWCAYEAVLGICDMTDIPGDVLEPFLGEHPWMRERREQNAVSLNDFVKFAALFRIPNRKATAWYAKHDFWLHRSGLVTYLDEQSLSA